MVDSFKHGRYISAFKHVRILILICNYIILASMNTVYIVTLGDIHVVKYMCSFNLGDKDSIS